MLDFSPVILQAFEVAGQGEGRNAVGIDDLRTLLGIGSAGAVVRAASFSAIEALTDTDILAVFHINGQSYRVFVGPPTSQVMPRTGVAVTAGFVTTGGGLIMQNAGATLTFMLESWLSDGTVSDTALGLVKGTTASLSDAQANTSKINTCLAILDKGVSGGGTLYGSGHVRISGSINKSWDHVHMIGPSKGFGTYGGSTANSLANELASQGWVLEYHPSTVRATRRIEDDMIVVLPKIGAGPDLVPVAVTVTSVADNGSGKARFACASTATLVASTLYQMRGTVNYDNVAYHALVIDGTHFELYIDPAHTTKVVYIAETFSGTVQFGSARAIEGGGAQNIVLWGHWRARYGVHIEDFRGALYSGIRVIDCQEVGWFQWLKGCTNTINGNQHDHFDNIASRTMQWPRTLSSVTDAGGGKALYTTSGNHLYQVGDKPRIDGTTNYNRPSRTTVIDTVPSPTTFTCKTNLGADVPYTGAMVASSKGAGVSVHSDMRGIVIGGDPTISGGANNSICTYRQIEGTVQYGHAWDYCGSDTNLLFGMYGGGDDVSAVAVATPYFENVGGLTKVTMEEWPGIAVGDIVYIRATDNYSSVPTKVTVIDEANKKFTCDLPFVTPVVGDQDGTVYVGGITIFHAEDTLLDFGGVSNGNCRHNIVFGAQFGRGCAGRVGTTRVAQMNIYGNTVANGSPVQPYNEVIGADQANVNFIGSDIGGEFGVGPAFTRSSLGLEFYTDVIDTVRSAFLRKGLKLGVPTGSPVDTAGYLDAQGVRVNNQAVLTYGTITALRETLYVPAAQMTALTTNGAGSFLNELATNKAMQVGYAFDTTTAESVQFSVELPKKWDLGDVKFKVHWTAGSGSGGVAWTLKGLAVSDNDAQDVAFGTSLTRTDTLLTANSEHITPESTALTIGGTPAVGDRIIFQMTRSVANASDTLGVDAILLGVSIFFNVTSLQDD